MSIAGDLTAPFRVFKDKNKRKGSFTQRFDKAQCHDFHVKLINLIYIKQGDKTERCLSLYVNKGKF